MGNKVRLKSEQTVREIAFQPPPAVFPPPATTAPPPPTMGCMKNFVHKAKQKLRINLANAYYQIPLYEDSRGLTAFITHEGLFRYKRVCYGLASAPSAFQRMMSVVQQNLPGVQAYLDDIIVYLSCRADHETHLKAVLYRLQEAGLCLNTEKCKFYQDKLTYLGHTKVERVCCRTTTTL